MKKDSSYRARHPEINDVMPDVGIFLEKRSRRRLRSARDEESPKDIPETGMISDMGLTAEIMTEVLDEFSNAYNLNNRGVITNETVWENS